MTFWDTIAKMCGVRIKIRPERTLITNGWHNREPWSVLIEASSGVANIVVDSSVTSESLMINGHGIRIRDLSLYEQMKPREPWSIGAIGFERIRPMATKSGDVTMGIASSGARMSQEKPS